MCAGDFNELLRQDEKLGGALRNHQQMQLFRDAIDECGFMDLGFIRPKFTWSKHFENGHSIWERLDRGSATNNWFLKFIGTRVHHLHCDSSDHSPLLINLSGLDHPPRKKKIQFEEMYLSDSRCFEIMEASWNLGMHELGDNAILKRVEKCGKDLSW